jgi:hypothetical protein
MDRFGRWTIHVVPGLGKVGELLTRAPAQAAAISPTGQQIAMACSDGRVRFIAVEGMDGVPLAITVQRSLRRRANALQRFFGRSTVSFAFSLTCPACRQLFELPNAVVGQTYPCTKCRRKLRVACVAVTSTS